MAKFNQEPFLTRKGKPPRHKRPRRACFRVDGVVYKFVAGKAVLLSETTCQECVRTWDVTMAELVSIQTFMEGSSAHYEKSYTPPVPEDELVDA